MDLPFTLHTGYSWQHKISDLIITKTRQNTNRCLLVVVFGGFGGISRVGGYVRGDGFLFLDGVWWLWVKNNTLLDIGVAEFT